MDKYLELYNLSKEGLKEEFSGYNRIEEKASRHLTVLSILLVVSTFTGNFALDKVVPPRGQVSMV